MNEDNLVEYLNKCRFCLSDFTKGCKKISLSATLIEQFHQLTQIKVDPTDENYSKHICKTCKRNLQDFQSLKEDYIKKQAQLQKQLCPPADFSRFNLQEVRIKIEPLDSCLLVQPEENNDDYDVLNDDPGWQEDVKEESTDDDGNQKARKPPKKREKKEDEVPGEAFEFKLKPQRRNVERRFKCKICGVSHITEKTLENHVMYNHSNTLTREEILRIKKRNREDRMRICPMCGMKVDQLNRHIKKEHLNIKRYFCDHCPYSSFKRFDISSHVLKHRKKPKKEFMCDFCGTGFVRKTSMRQHYRDFHSNTQPFVCSICSQSFKTLTLMKKHQKWKHERGHKIRCPDCDKELAQYCLEKHIMRDPETYDQKFVCLECRKEFKNKRCLAYHRQLHNKREFICEFLDCGKSYSTLNQLNTHQKRHTNEKKLKCPYEGCDKAYFKQQNLRIHIANYHANFKKKCPVKDCEYMTGSYNYMRDHIIRHKELRIEVQREMTIMIKQMDLVS